MAAVIGRTGVGARLGVWWGQRLKFLEAVTGAQTATSRLCVWRCVCERVSLSLSECHLSEAAGLTRLPPLVKKKGRREGRKKVCGLLVGPSDHGLLRVHVIRQVSVLISKPPWKNLVMKMMVLWWILWKKRKTELKNKTRMTAKY